MLQSFFRSATRRGRRGDLSCPAAVTLEAMTLGCLKVGHCGIVRSICPNRTHCADLERRLIEMGFEEGASVEVLHQGFPAQDPIAVRIGGSTVALRRREARAVLLEPLPEPLAA